VVAIDQNSTTAPMTKRGDAEPVDRCLVPSHYTRCLRIRNQRRIPQPELV